MSRPVITDPAATNPKTFYVYMTRTYRVVVEADTADAAQDQLATMDDEDMGACIDTEEVTSVEEC